ncbi:MAG: hypothetical protein ACFCVH_06195 [Alphaproteobacteria bacterium]
MNQLQVPACLFEPFPGPELTERQAKSLLQHLAYVEEIANDAVSGLPSPDGCEWDMLSALDSLALDLSVNVGHVVNLGVELSPWLIQTTWTFAWESESPHKASDFRDAADEVLGFVPIPPTSEPDAVLTWLGVAGARLLNLLRRLTVARTVSEAALHLCLIDMTLVQLLLGTNQASLRLRLDRWLSQGERKARP